MLGSHEHLIVPPRFLGPLIVTTVGLLCLHSCGGLELLDLIVLGLIPATKANSLRI